MSFAYSREVVRNTVLLYPSLHGSNSNNSARDGDPTINADIFLESPEVVAMSVYALIATPSVCAFLWLLLLGWNTCFNPTSEKVLDNNGSTARRSLRLNNGATARRGLRLYSFKAVHLFRYLDESLSQQQRWSGRNTDTPYIRDLDADTTTPSIPSYPKPEVVRVQEPHEMPRLRDVIWNKVVSWFRGAHYNEGFNKQQYDVRMTGGSDPIIPRQL